MTVFLLLIIFAAFAALMFTRKMPALIALPAMAILTAFVVGLPLPNVLNDVISAGAVRLAPAYVAVFAGAMLGRVMMTTGIAEEIIKRAAEFGGDKPLIVAFGLMIVTTILFTTLTGLGGIIMVGSLVLPIMMSLGIPRKLAGILFLLAFATGFIFNLANWRFYGEVLKIPQEQLQTQIFGYAAGLFLIMALAVIVFTVVAARRSKEMSLWAMKTTDELTRRNPEKRVPLISFLTPIVPLILYVGLGWKEVPCFLAGALFGLLTTEPKNAIRNLTSSVIRGVEDAAPAAVLMIGIGMLLNALTLPAVRESLEPFVRMIPFGSPAAYILFFGLLSPLALYRGPLNLFGVGIGLYSIIAAAGVLPPLALLAAIMAVVQVQNVCDPTNTHNVWIANYVGVRVEELTKSTILTMILVCFGGLILGTFLFLR